MYRGAQVNPVIPQVPKGTEKLIGCAVAIVVLIVAIIVLNVWGVAGYFLHPVGANEVGIMFSQGNPYDVVGPGIYTKIGFFETIHNIDIHGLAFRVADVEVLTHDKQRIGVEVSGTVHRPSKKETVLTNWAPYSNFYVNDQLLAAPQQFDKDGRVVNNGGLISSLAQQSMKVCVGDVDFDKAVIGSARDDLKNCIDTELDKLAKGYGLEVRNIVVPNVILSPEVQKRLDDITQARLNTQLANQRELQNTAEAQRDRAAEQGKILVEQGRIQEKARQDAITAELNKKALDAQKQVIEAEKSNQLLAANRTKEIADVDRQTALINAQAKVAEEQAKAQLYSSNPLYVELQKIQAEAAAYTRTDKWIMVPSGTNPLLFFGQTGPTSIPIPTPPPSK